MKLCDMTVTEFVNTVASDAPAPGGGSVAALAGSIGAALTAMVGNLTQGRKKYAEYAAFAAQVETRGNQLKAQLLDVMDRDTEAFLLVSNAPARVLPTIQSRCRKLKLRPLDPADVVRAAADAAEIAPTDASLQEVSALAEGSVARALMLLGGATLGLQQRMETMLQALPQVDPKALHGLGDALAGTDRVALLTFADTVERWLGRQLAGSDPKADLPRLARLSEVWEKVTRAVRDTQDYNLERKPLVFSVFGMLAEAMR